MPKKAAEPLFDQLSKTLETDGEELVSKLKVHAFAVISDCQLAKHAGLDCPSWLWGLQRNKSLCFQGLVLFKIDDEEWTLDLRSGKGKVSKGGAGSDKPDLTLTISDENFVKLVMGKMGPQQVWC